LLLSAHGSSITQQNSSQHSVLSIQP
jgi:hypothetical protein